MNSKGECCRFVMPAVAIMFAVSCLSMADNNNGRDSSITILPVRMPGATASRNNAYLCTSVTLYKREEYVVRFEPKASQDVAHHMLLFGCYEPGSDKKIWDCGEMERMECQGKQKILFAWAKDAPAKDLPKGVAFKIGKSSNLNHLVLQVHYKHKAKDGVKDNSGILLHTTLHRQPFLAGIFLLWSGYTDIAPETNGVHTDVGCTFEDKQPIYAFAYRTHAHSLGRVISGYKVHGKNWTLLGKKSPQEPQAFYPTKKIVKISKGDILAARCTYDAKGHHLTKHVKIGSSGKDEMCNFYIMYYRDASLPDIANDLCSDEDMEGLTINFPPDSVTTKPLKTIKNINKSHERPSSDIIIATTDPKEKDLTHSNTRNEKYEVVKDWPKLGKERLGQVSGVALDLNGNVILFHRGKRTWNLHSFDRQHRFNGQEPIREYTVLTLNPSNGRIIDKWGKNTFYLPHGITVDHDGNLWLTDVAMHQVFKYRYSPMEDDLPLLSVGEMFVPGSDDEHFCQPTDVAVENNGVFYVSDGYCNSRIMKFSPKGKVLAKWGKSSGSFSLNIPHSIAIDVENKRLYVADRENGRIQYVDTRTGQFGQPITNQQFGLLYAVDFNINNGLLYAINGNSLQSNHHVKGFTLRAKDGSLFDSWPSGKHYFSHPHDVVSSSYGANIYVVEIRPNKVWKLTKRGQASHAMPLNNEDTVHGKIRENHTKEDTDSSFPSNYNLGTDAWQSKENLPVECTHEKETGPCRAAIQRWYYDINKRRCLHFIYGGCQGNENKFQSLKECQAKCFFRERSKQRNNLKQESKKSEDMLKKFPSKEDEYFRMNDTKFISKKKSEPRTEVHETDDWQNAAGEDEGKESNLHVWKTINITSTTMTTPHQIKKIHSSNKDDIQAGMVPALIILSVLAVPIIFLLLISIVLRVRAYRRERRYKSKRLLNKEGLAVNRTVGWWSYLNCFSKRKYAFDKVNLAEFYSDSESDGV